VTLRCWLPPRAFPRLAMLQFATRFAAFGVVYVLFWLVMPPLWLFGLILVGWPISYVLEFSEEQLVAGWLMWRVTLARTDFVSARVIEDPRWGVIGKRPRILEVCRATDARFRVDGQQETLVHAAAWFGGSEAPVPSMGTAS
jgi:hypothetical protein